MAENNANFDLLEKAITLVKNKNDKQKPDTQLKCRAARVVSYDNSTFQAIVCFIDDNQNNEYALINKTSEKLSENDTVKVYYTTNAAKGWIGARMGAVNRKPDSSSYISVPVSNSQEVKYDSIEQNILNVNFNVVESDSAVVFAGNQKCLTSSNGTLDCVYKVDGKTQDFKPSQKFLVGKNIMPHYFPMSLNVGEHNFAIYISSADGGKGTTAISDLYGALSGKISGITNIAPSNTNLLIYISGVPDGFELTIPRLYESDTSINQIVEWGDDTDPETSTCGSAISHTYAAGGDYTVTVKSDSKKFSDGGSGSFSWQEYLTAIYFPDDALKITYTVSLKNCPKLSAIKLGSAAQEISLNFQNNGQAITALIIPEPAQKLTFTNLSATGITSLIIPKNVTSIANIGSVPSLTYLEVMCAKTPYVYNSKALTKVVLGENVQTIKEYGFASCSALSEVKFSAAIAKIENGAFQNCTSLKELPLLPNLTSLGSNAFEKCTALAKAEISDGITKILSLTFCGCTSLMSVNIPKNVVEIGQRAFEQVPAPLSKDDFPDTLKTFGVKAFYQSGIVSARLISGATYGSEVFAYCSSLTEVAVDDGVLTIPNKCFQYCTSLSSINLPSSVTTIDTAAFEGSGLTNINLPDGLLTINQNAFNKCSLSSVTIPSSVTTLKSNAFSNNLNLTSATINDVGFNVLPSNIFNGCKALTSVNLGRSIDTLEGSNFSDCTSLDDVDLSNIIKIGGFAFSGCSSLKSVSFKSGVVIEGNAFRYTGFTSLILTPFLAELTSGTTSQGGRYNIGGSAFAGCKNLSSVDNYRYKFTVGLKKTEKFLEDDGWRTVETDLGAQSDALGIYNYWGATTDSVFSGTALKSAGDYLKEHPEYKNESTSTYSRTYSAYNIIPN